MADQSRDSSPDPADDRPPVNFDSVLRYPFREMRTEWFDDYMDNISSSKRIPVATRLMDCLMAHTVLHEDPFLEKVVTVIYNRVANNEAFRNMTGVFGEAHEVFRIVCMTAKFTVSSASEKNVLLNLLEQHCTRFQIAAQKVKSDNSEALVAAAERVTESVFFLRKNMASTDAFRRLMDAIKSLFFIVNTRNGVSPGSSDGKSVFNTFVCCDGCPCYAKLRTGPTVFLRDMEKIKILDCVMMAATNAKDALMLEMATRFLHNFCKDFMENPHLDDIGNLIHNGRLFYCRTALFDALNTITSPQPGFADVQTAKTVNLDRIVLALLWVKNEVKDIRILCKLVPTLNEALASAEVAYTRLDSDDVLQILHTLKEYILAIFAALSFPEYHLAVHSRDVFIGKQADMKCANPACPGSTKDLLKCSGCDVTFYCSSECQKADWDKHKNFCHEIESRRTQPTSAAFCYSSPQVIKPVS
ncbi:hypothetical protein ABB37_05933 [Leptomonas pyrrhocoris]|uniref:MYND-type domain-containing protein n=1 Tax=Leptomonas pyrrhocoris TaxID=157538 RepID=A0A0N0DUF5_LEPPY|nr:hypothetical protein ABB37_05933 [Leptomonas pyrrhocoris]KPA78861.1 hypothetical protein ABB37_05933 [Leptomonas pyrrhocoris]|eukprot:XP_015657300.1 hypothetical protein ABB37_05933 [Leptomonas pyrrhocoris]